MTKQWIGVLLAVAVVAGPAAGQARNGKNDPLGAYKRLDNAKLAEQLQAMNMKEMIEVLGEQSAQSKDIPNVFVTAQCKANVALSEIQDMARREKLMAEAIELMQQCVKATAEPKDDHEYIQYFLYRVALVRMLGYDRCALYADKVMMLIGGTEDRRLLEEYTRPVLLPGKDKDGETKPMLSDILDQMQMKLEEWQPTPFYMETEPAEKAAKELRYYAAWMYLYRGLGLTESKSKVSMLEQALAAAEPFLKNDDGEDDPAILLLTGIARSELAVETKDESGFQKAQELFQKGQSGSAPYALKVNLEFQSCCNLVLWGKYEEASKRISNLPMFIANLMGNKAAQSADMRAALLNNFLYDNWAKSEKDAKKAVVLAGKGQEALVAFITKYAKDKSATGDFLKMLAEKYRGEDVTKLTPLLQYAVAVDRFDKYALMYKAEKKDTAAMEKERKAAIEALDLVLASDKPEVQELKPAASERRLALGGGWSEMADLALKTKTKNGLYNAAISLKKHLEANMGDTALVRRKLVQIVETLATVPEFQKDTEAQELYYDLGEQYRQLAKRSMPDEEMVEFLARGANAFGKVPPRDPRTTLGSRFRQIVMERDRLIALNEPSLAAVAKKLNANLATEADALVRKIEQFVADAKAQTPKADAALAKDLQNWSSLALLSAGELQWELRNDKTNVGKVKAKAIFETIRNEYKDSPAVVMSWEYQIRRAIEEGNTEEAIQGIGEIRKKAPEQATALMGQVITQVQANITKLAARGAAGDEDKLKALRKTYMEFAKSLLDTAPADQKVPYEQLYADALLENGQAEPAREIFARLFEAEDKARKEQEAKIDERMGKKIEELKSKTMREAIKQLGVEFPALVKQEGLPAGSMYEKEVAAAVVRVGRENMTEEDAKYQYGNLTDKLKQGYEGMSRDLKARVAVSLINLQGLARANHQLKNYPEAMKYYDQLVNGLSPVDYPVEYWTAQVRRTTCQTDRALTLSGEERDKSLRYLQMWIESYRKTGNRGIDATIMSQFDKLEQRIKAAMAGK